MTVTDWPVRSPPAEDGAALPAPVVAAGALAPPLAALVAAGGDVAALDEHAAATSVATAMKAAILDRRLVGSSIPFLLSRTSDPTIGSIPGVSDDAGQRPALVTRVDERSSRAG
jgi:hypothetical protein